MGQGLSPLQRRILCLLFREKFATCAEILTENYGIGCARNGTAIDKARYASAHASLSRCLTRLWERGLITYWKTLSHYQTGVSLSNEGEALAQALSDEATEDPNNG